MHAESFIELERTSQTGFPIVETLASAMIFIHVLS